MRYGQAASVSVTLILFVCYFCYQSYGSPVIQPSSSSHGLVGVHPFYSFRENAAICCSLMRVRNMLVF